MQGAYNQFCPIAKASEIIAVRWMPLILRELMADIRTFNNIHRGIPLISRAVLVARLRELEHHGIIVRRKREGRQGSEYWLTPAGDALRPIVSGLGHWGLVHARDSLTPEDLDPTFLLWGFRKRAIRDALPNTARSPTLCRSISGMRCGATWSAKNCSSKGIGTWRDRFPVGSSSIKLSAGTFRWCARPPELTPARSSRQRRSFSISRFRRPGIS